MKKGILILALLLTGFSYSFANTTDGIKRGVFTTFSKDFSNARDIQWEYKSNYMVATFSMSNEVMFAYYTNDGQLFAVARNILSDQLPISLLMSLKKNYPGYWISNLFEVNKNESTAYYITLDNADEKLVLRSSENGGWGVFSRNEKE
jgi:hypothetical protein